MPVADVRGPHLRSLTAVDGTRRRLPSNMPPDHHRRPGVLRYFKLNEAWSMITPGPMVELSEIFCR